MAAAQTASLLQKALSWYGVVGRSILWYYWPPIDEWAGGPLLKRKRKEGLEEIGSAHLLTKCCNHIEDSFQARMGTLWHQIEYICRQLCFFYVYSTVWQEFQGQGLDSSFRYSVFAIVPEWPEKEQLLSHDSNIWVTVFSDDVQLTFCFQLDSTLIHNMFAQWHMFCQFLSHLVRHQGAISKYCEKTRQLSDAFTDQLRWVALQEFGILFESQKSEKTPFKSFCFTLSVKLQFGVICWM